MEPIPSCDCSAIMLSRRVAREEILRLVNGLRTITSVSNSNTAALKREVCTSRAMICVLSLTSLTNARSPKEASAGCLTLGR